MNFLLAMSIPFFFMIPFWWSQYGKIMKDTMTFHEEKWVGALIWSMHILCLYSLFHLNSFIVLLNTQITY